MDKPKSPYPSPADRHKERVVDDFVARAGQSNAAPVAKEEKAPQARYNAIMPLDLYNRVMSDVIPQLEGEVNPNNGKVKKVNLSMYLRNLVIADIARRDAEKE